MRNILTVPLLFFFSGCMHRTEKYKNNELVIEQSDKLKVIILKKNDSTLVRINLDSFINLKRIVSYKNQSIDGESMTFYSNGKVEKKVSNVDAIREGHTQYFYRSGSIKSDLFYYNGKPHFYAIEYWDYFYGTPKHVIVFGDNGKVEKIRNYDTLGNYLHDSVPPVNSLYPDPFSPDY